MSRRTDQPLADQVAIVTGASSGIGRATALAVARAAGRPRVGQPEWTCAGETNSRNCERAYPFPARTDDARDP